MSWRGFTFRHALSFVTFTGSLGVAAWLGKLEIEESPARAESPHFTAPAIPQSRELASNAGPQVAALPGTLRFVTNLGGAKTQMGTVTPEELGLTQHVSALGAVRSVDFGRLATRLKSAFEAYAHAPRDARLRLSPRTIVPEVEGSYPDLYSVAQQLSRLGTGDDAEVEVAFRSVPPARRRTHAESLDASSLVSSYETHFSRKGDQLERGLNIDNAAEKLDGLILWPKRIVSFNDVVGERSVENGFHPSFEIYKGEMIEGIGGGTCQAATTFHAAAFFGGLDVPERLPHSRPSVYVPMGLDATVVFPIVDLKVINPLDSALVVRAFTEGNTMRVELHGSRKELRRVVFSREVEENLPYVRKVVENEKRHVTEVIHKQHGIPGYKIKRVRTLVYADGKKREEILHDAYPPTADVYEVPQGFDEAELPSLPEGEGTPLEPGELPPTPATVDQPLAVAFKMAKGAHTPTTAQLFPARRLTLAQ